MATTNYSFPEFTEEGTPDLIGVYNAAMVAIDTKLKELSDSIANTINLDAVKADVKNLQTRTNTLETNMDTLLDNIVPGPSDTSLTVAELN